ncbi:molybdenum cofactor guanylyltransferase MobA [Agrobacterium sp.]|jgi:molybdopterin-guanine dinucleotide biosynthesis protein A|uniref:molybdenum cofactor guanylyltransferase MobA n=1 Tax=Agrobacterium sp. TaxID=361 RepID=UPI0028AB8F1C|nr:molybdenum cofactor guanylyltransferase MobA [Agrobacterium sp.]
MHKNLPGLILAGGLSRRMGSNKALKPLGDRQLLSHVIERIRPQVSYLALNAPHDWADAFGLPVVPDTKLGHAGPLAGVLAGLRHITTIDPDATHMLTVPADSPFFPETLGQQLSSSVADDHTIVIAASAGQVHPVFGLWPVSIADDLEQWLAVDENRRIRNFLGRHATLGISFPKIESPTSSIDAFFNINTPDELSIAQAFLDTLD